LSPKNTYPTHLIDVKRAIRWTKQNISSFGGDPDFIVLSGDSAGGHLSAMASLTANDPQYQPGFEDVDTSFRAVISVNGALDVASNHHHASFFSHSVANLSKVDMEFLHQHSPASLAKHVHTLVPFLCLAGERDNLVEIDMAKNFKKSYDQGKLTFNREHNGSNNNSS
jgi:acetyl esterase/lipase